MFYRPVYVHVGDQKHPETKYFEEMIQVRYFILATARNPGSGGSPKNSKDIPDARWTQFYYFSNYVGNMLMHRTIAQPRHESHTNLS